MSATMAVTPQPGGAPAQLRAVPQWVGWKLVHRAGKKKPDKLPVHPHTGGMASTNAPDTWGEYAAAVRGVSRFKLAGVGFVFADTDSFSGVDLDDCRNPYTGEIAPWGWEIIRALNSYSEVSPSGTGVKIFLEGKLPGTGKRTKYQTGAVEMYSRLRYFTVTGDHIEGTPVTLEPRQTELAALHAKIFGARHVALASNFSPQQAKIGLAGDPSLPPQQAKIGLAGDPGPEVRATVLDDAALLERAHGAKDGWKFQRLWAGEWKTDYLSQSEADLALCSLLAFWTGRDPARMDRLFRRSGLMREKWNRADYRESTLAKACAASAAFGHQRQAALGLPAADRQEPTVKDEQPRAPEFSDDALALRFTQSHAADLRYTAAWGHWHVWTGARWRPDQTWCVFDLARGVCRQASARCPDTRTAPRIASAATVAAGERLARADRLHAATVDQWDANPWLLNTPAGVVDLRTGTLRPAARDDYMTKITAAGPGGDCRLWQQFLGRVTEGNASLQEYLQRMCGYALTGITQEHALFFLYGTGANGKSVFLNTMAGLLGEYAKTAPMEAFLASVTEHHPTDVAGLHGARLVTAVETEDGRRWAESKLKLLTGGDRIAARFMRQDFFEFTPQFKLVVAGNHRPGLRTVDEAMRRRFNLLPFTVTIPVCERDAELGEKLRGEWSGVLQWAIEGCLAWQRQGLNPPALVREATDQYLASEDSIARWMEDCCVLSRKCWTSGTALFGSWRGWCDRNQEHAGSQKQFTQNLEARGFVQDRQYTSGGRARGFAGIGLATDRGTDGTDPPV